MNPLSRRRVLKTSAGAVLGSVLPGMAAERKKKVVIVGGGIGGLCCAADLMERGHEVTLLEASKRTGGHVKTIYDPLPDGLYADVGAEQFSNPGYDIYREWVRKFDLPVLEYRRRRDMYRRIRGQWRTEAELEDAATQREFGFNERELDYLQALGWTELPRLFFGPMAERFADEYEPFGIGLDELDHITIGDWLMGQGASDAAREFCGGGRLSTKENPPTERDVSALYRIWQEAIVQKRGLPVFKREVFRLEGGNQLLPDTLAQHLGDRVHKNCRVEGLDHNETGVKVSFKDGPDAATQTIEADYAVLCVSPLVIGAIRMTPALPAEKIVALTYCPMSMGCRVVLQAKTRFWEGDSVPSINLATGHRNMALVYECAGEVPGESCVLMGTGQPAQSPEETLAAFREFYPGQNPDTIERTIVHVWPVEEPLALGCERTPFALGRLKQIWPQLIAPVGRIHFAGAAYDNLPWGQDAATRSARRVTLAIDGA